MPLNLITSPAGAGKTQYVVDQIHSLQAGLVLARILVIVPSGMQLVALRERLGARPGALFGVTLSDFHTLYNDLLDAAGALPRLLPEAARYRVVRHTLRMLVDIERLPYFKPIADKPGLITSVSGLIAELKEARIQPEAFSELASTPRTRDLASIYSTYQDFLKLHNLSDREGRGWLALAALDADPRLYADFDYVAADGFDEFNPTQLELLNRLAARVPRLDVTLTYEPHRRAQARLADTFKKFEHAAHVELRRTAPSRAAALEHLERYLFEPNPPRVQAGDAVTLTAAPDRAREVRAIGRGIKRLLLEGVAPSEIAVVMRHLSPYQSIFREVFSEFGIPFRVRAGMPLVSNPLIAALLNLITLAENEFPWRETLDALRSPYFLQRDLNAEQVAQVERTVREAVVVKGREAWLDAFTKPPEPAKDEHDSRLVRELTEEQILALRAGVESFLTWVTPPAKATIPDFAAFIENLIGPDPQDEAWRRENVPAQFEEDATSFRVIECARAGQPELAARDLAALVEFKNVLRGLVEAAEVLGEEACEWELFSADLLDAVSAASYDLTPMADGRVVIAGVTQARGVSRDHVFLGGLVESEFPSRAPEDPLLLASERDDLRAANIPLANVQTRDETTLFYEAATLARKRVYLSYPYLDDDGNPLFPSPYISSVRQLFEDLDVGKIGINASPGPEEAASLSELAVSLAAPGGLRQRRAREIERALSRESPAWTHSQFARAIEARRESPAACDQYSGVICDPALQAEIAARFTERHPWSATQFNEWGACGFRFYARRLLALEEMVEPEEGLQAWQLGSVYHNILEETYRALARRKMAVTPDTLDDAQALLRETAIRVLADAPAQFAFRATAWWAQERAEIVRRLERLLAADAERNVGHPSVPCEMELRFDVTLDGEEGPLRIKGRIDRMDRREDGAVLVDYKSSSTKIYPGEVEAGRNLQLPVYVLAAEALGYRVADAYFCHIGDGKTSGKVEPEARGEWLQKAKGHMQNYVARTRAGEFSVKPAQFKNGVCTAYCEFESLCRVGRWSAHKGERPTHA